MKSFELCAVHGSVCKEGTVPIMSDSKQQQSKSSEGAPQAQQKTDGDVAVMASRFVGELQGFSAQQQSRVLQGTAVLLGIQKLQPAAQQQSKSNQQQRNNGGR